MQNTFASAKLELLSTKEKCWLFCIIFSDSDYEQLDLINYTTLFIGFKDVTCIKYRRTVYMTWDNLLGIEM